MLLLQNRLSKGGSVSEFHRFDIRRLNFYAEKFAKKLLGESEIEGVLRRLDRLTQEEGRVTLVQTLEVVCGLVNNVKVVINGTQDPELVIDIETRSRLTRWKGVGERHLEGLR